MQNAQVSNAHIIWPPGHSPASSIVFAQNAIEIASAPETVWSLLIDCTSWPAWYRHCADVSVLGSEPLGVGSRFRFKTFGLYVEPQIETFDAPRMLVWSAKGPLGISGAHAWYIEPTPQGCRVVTEETQKGWLLLLRQSRMRNDLLTWHQEWLQGLKELAEAR